MRDVLARGLIRRGRGYPDGVAAAAIKAREEAWGSPCRRNIGDICKHPVNICNYQANIWEHLGTSGHVWARLAKDPRKIRSVASARQKQAHVQPSQGQLSA